MMRPSATCWSRPSETVQPNPPQARAELAHQRGHYGARRDRKGEKPSPGDPRFRPRNEGAVDLARVETVARSPGRAQIVPRRALPIAIRAYRGLTLLNFRYPSVPEELGVRSQELGVRDWGPCARQGMNSNITALHNQRGLVTSVTRRITEQRNATAPTPTNFRGPIRGVS